MARAGKIPYFRLSDELHRNAKFEFLEKKKDVSGVKWKALKPDERQNWFPASTDAEFETFLPIGSKEAKAGTSLPTTFKTYSLGISTNRDSVVYDFDADKLARRSKQFCIDYNSELRRWKKSGEPEEIDNFVDYEKVKWSRDLKRKFRQGQRADFNDGKVRASLYRPFTRKHLFLHRMLVDTPGTFDEFLPAKKAEKENRVICLSDVGLRSPFSCLATNALPDLHLCASTDGFQTFPLFTYSADGKHRQDNVTPKAKTLLSNFLR